MSPAAATASLQLSELASRARARRRPPPRKYAQPTGQHFERETIDEQGGCRRRRHGFCRKMQYYGRSTGGGGDDGTVPSYCHAEHDNNDICFCV